MNSIKEFFLYLVVGGIATVTEWVLFLILDKVSVHYTLATITAYIVSTFVNWLVGRVLVFTDKSNSVIREIIGVYMASIIGLLMNLIIMWMAIDALALNGMISKIIATGIVFLYNFLVRKLLIYKKA